MAAKRKTPIGVSFTLKDIWKALRSIGASLPEILRIRIVEILEDPKQTKVFLVRFKDKNAELIAVLEVSLEAKQVDLKTKVKIDAEEAK